MSKRGHTVEVRKTLDTMWASLDNGHTRFGICCDRVLVTSLDVPKAISVPEGLDDESFEEWVYNMLRYDAWREVK